MPQSITLKVNGKSKTISADPNEPLLYVLRNDFDLKGAKYGCGLQQCGACMVLADSKAEPTCLRPCVSFENMEITTLEGLQQNGKLHAVQQAFIDVQAAQCGYCVNGMIISAVALLENTPNPSDQEIRTALNPVICRCGTHSRFIQAVKLASETSNA
ncbi:nicotinate dehydrogenase subunit A [Algoriphagus sp. 4150]|uniref:(2Fe-2S)-binding protein n=1 Tax=Algoriphagus sp. 4150 TaxID=2817756 RepID=UPI0028609343|nr:2Fe-2S iron-sulfur cluster-binding protein [Algoriphagus sp. 4150]MDR7130404.1 nicotinate dehydrogenase subunit A [Algoriphagus sp. 4150]